jgi:hypothetical protein
MMMMIMKMIFWSNWWNEFGRGNRSTRRKPAPAPLCPPQNPTWWPGLEPRTAAVGSQRITAWAMAQPYSWVFFLFGGVGHEDDCGVIGGANDDCRGNRSTRRKPAQRYNATQTKSHMPRSGFEPRTAAVGSQRLTAWAMAQPYSWVYSHAISSVTSVHFSYMLNCAFTYGF